MKFIPLIVLIFLFSCQQGKEKYKEKLSLNTIQKPDSTLIKTQWKRIKKSFHKIDSIEAWKFFKEQPFFIKSDSILKEYHEIHFSSIDLNEDGIKEIFLLINDWKSFLFLNNKEQNWDMVWSHYYEDEAKAELMRKPPFWIKEYSYFPCSHCSNNKNHYSKLVKDSLVDILNISTFFSYEHESENSLIEEICIGKETIDSNKLTIEFEVELNGLVFKEKNRHEGIFLQDSLIKVDFEIIDNQNLLLKSTYPKELKSSYLKWQNNLTPIKNNPSYIVLLAYIDFKKKHLLSLKKKKTYKSLIELIELDFETSWEDLVSNWSTHHSHLSRYYQRNKK